MSDADTPLPADLAILIADRFAVLGDPMRVRILDVLRRHGEASVGEVAEQLQAGYANVAKHLGLLARERIVAREKEGNRAIYRIADQTVLSLCEVVCGAIEQRHTELAALVSNHQFTPAASAGTSEVETQ